jgi:dUTP pyrophosphatase
MNLIYIVQWSIKMQKNIVIKIVKNSSVTSPKYMTIGAAGADICADISTNIEIKPMERMLIPTGIKMAIPLGYEVQLRPRSGLALKHGLTLLNTPGTIDSDYRGEVKVLVVNLGLETIVIKPQERIAQIVVQEVIQGRFVEVEDLEASERADGGFGHTGK